MSVRAYLPRPNSRRACITNASAISLGCMHFILLLELKERELVDFAKERLCMCARVCGVGVYNVAALFIFPSLDNLFFSLSFCHRVALHFLLSTLCIIARRSSLIDRTRVRTDANTFGHLASRECKEYVE